ncbi:MAG: DUF5615 family PIN-like protein [Gemmataceae bacterium]
MAETLPFLLDEQAPEFLADELLRLEPALDIGIVGQDHGLKKGTKDPVLIGFCEEHQMIFITLDKKTTPGHLTEHFRAGRHTWGVLICRQGHPTKAYAEEIVLLWSTMTKDEWRDFSLYIPL